MDNRNINVTQHVGEVKKGGTVIGVQVVYQGEPVRIPSPEDTQLHRADLARIETYNRWADEFYIKEEGKVLPLFASPYEDDGGRKREDLLQTIRSHQRLLVLGEPGMGKTVALERMVWETSKAEESIVPVFVQLLYFQGGDLIELIRVALNETRWLTFDNAKSVRAFLRETKCLILFDGLNETPGRQREQVIGTIANFMREYPEHHYVVTSRSQDELWRKLRSAELIQDAVVVQTISDAQAKGYLQAHLGQEKGQALYDRLDASLKSLARTPLLLKLIKDAGGGSDQLPRNRGELFDKYVMNKLLERERQKLELVESPIAKKKALSHLAFALQLNHQLACDREWAEKILAEKGLGARTDTLLEEALLHGLLIQQILPDKQLLRFIHQSVQEYFVALTLLSEVKIEKNANLIQVASRRLSKHNLTAWAKDNWWSESFVQLAGLLDDADWLAKRIMNASPWLAWWCVHEGRDVPENTWEMIEARSIKLLHSQNVAERRRAVQTLAQIKNDRVLEPLLIAAGDNDEEVAGLSLQVLKENSETVHPLIKKVLQDDDRRNWRASLRYLRNIPSDMLWVDIPDQMLEMLEAPDKQNYIRAITGINNERSLQKIFYYAGDGNAVVEDEAAQALVKKGEPARLLIKKALQGEDRRAWKASLRYLGMQPIDALWTEIPEQALDEAIGQPMVWISAGSFLMGSDKSKDLEAGDNELPQHSVTLPGYWIARFPVTVARWKSFVKESGYKADTKSLQGPDNHPVRFVSWQDALAYCKWLCEKSGLPVKLPSEAEWEKAARGPSASSGDRRIIYPWGDEFDKNKCNTYESGIENTTPVGKYSPAGDSPYGCADMAGNVKNWTRSKYRSYPYKAEDGRENPEGAEGRVVRGGSWDDGQYHARVSRRYNLLPYYRFHDYGFRVVVHPEGLNHD